VSTHAHVLEFHVLVDCSTAQRGVRTGGVPLRFIVWQLIAQAVLLPPHFLPSFCVGAYGWVARICGRNGTTLTGWEKRITKMTPISIFSAHYPSKWDWLFPLGDICGVVKMFWKHYVNAKFISKMEKRKRDLLGNLKRTMIILITVLPTHHLKIVHSQNRKVELERLHVQDAYIFQTFCFYSLGSSLRANV